MGNDNNSTDKWADVPYSPLRLIFYLLIRAKSALFSSKFFLGDNDGK